jgi:hypothetical protein
MVIICGGPAVTVSASPAISLREPILIASHSGTRLVQIA